MRLIRRNENGEAIGLGVPLLVVGLLLALAVLGAGGAAVVASVREPAPRAFPKQNYVALPAMSIPVGGGSGREMDLKLLLEFDAKVKKDVAFGYETRISERLGDRIREIGMENLQGAEGARLLKGAVAAVVDRELRPVRVRDVLIEEMVVR